ncbi:MAG: D-alanine--D-alanine ligase [Candidatus Cloacimonetes bacterium]|nr:D-alanine--D-alanine ligase [Candidatus Cloacimonadota bacterium]
MAKIDGPVIVLSGGFSEEREVSLVSAREIAAALGGLGYEISMFDPADYPSYADMMVAIRARKPTFVFNGLHGAEGEDGRLQSLLELAGVPFNGCRYRACAIAMDKYISAIIAGFLNIRSPDKIIFPAPVRPPAAQLEKIGYPMVIKPNDSGSSVGITMIKEETELESAIKEAARYSRQILYEKYIRGKELTVTILGEEALPVVEIRPKQGWYDYRNKYTGGNTDYIIPAEIDNAIADRVKTMAQAIFKFMGGQVYARVDFRFDGKDIYFLEVNTLPGMTPLSLTPMAARAQGMEFPQLLEKIMELSLQLR